MVYLVYLYGIQISYLGQINLKEFYFDTRFQLNFRDVTGRGGPSIGRKPSVHSTWQRVQFLKETKVIHKALQTFSDF